jgi:pimeloyl-ACP methyl ester carboxylesterase
VQAISVTTPDGLTLAVQEWGNPRGAEILLIHGYNQSYLSWLRQVGDAALAADFRMVTLDLRGHGASDKPTDAKYYAHARWGDDIAAVMRATGLRRPVLVGWSFAGNVICDYLRDYGAAGIAGINFVAASTKVEQRFFGPGRTHLPDMSSSDLVTQIAGTRGFLRACFQHPPTEDDFEIMLAFNMVVPPPVRKAIMSRPRNPGDVLAQLRCPTLVTHGIDDHILVVALGEFTAAAVPGAKLSLYEGVGHAPFWEDAPRFNRELAEFTRQANTINQ